jgi:amino acid transporter
VPGARLVSRVSRRFHTPVYALLVGFLVPAIATLLVNINPSEPKKFLFITYPAKVNALLALVSFGVSGIYLSFLMTVIGAAIARWRGWRPAGAFTLGRWGWPVTIVAAGYLAVMLADVVLPTGLDSGRALFNIDWITLAVMAAIAVVGAVVFAIARPTRVIAEHRRAADADVPLPRHSRHDVGVAERETGTP